MSYDAYDLTSMIVENMCVPCPRYSKCQNCEDTYNYSQMMDCMTRVITLNRRKYPKKFEPCYVDETAHEDGMDDRPTETGFEHLGAPKKQEDEYHMSVEYDIGHAAEAIIDEEGIELRMVVHGEINISTFKEWKDFDDNSYLVVSTTGSRPWLIAYLKNTDQGVVLDIYDRKALKLAEPVDSAYAFWAEIGIEKKKPVPAPAPETGFEHLGTTQSLDNQLIEASRKGDLKSVQSLVKKGADIHADNDSALQWASGKGHLDIVKYLFENGADIHADNDYALRWASNNGHLAVVKYLVENNADIHAGDDFALRWASQNGHLDVVKYLVEKGANIHADNDSALRWASEHGHFEVVKFLVQNGANIHADNDFALQWARRNKHQNVVDYLEHVAKYGIRPPETGFEHLGTSSRQIPMQCELCGSFEGVTDAYGPDVICWDCIQRIEIGRLEHLTDVLGFSFTTFVATVKGSAAVAANKLLEGLPTFPSRPLSMRTGALKLRERPRLPLNRRGPIV